MFHAGTPGAQFQPDGTSGRIAGPAPDHGSYRSYATFSDPNWPDWYAAYMVAEQAGKELPL